MGEPVPQPPEVAITRLDTDLVVAEAVDERSAQLVTGVGFRRDQQLGPSQYRLPNGMSATDQQKTASLATRLLAQEGYAVALSPSLREGPLTPADPQDNYAAGRRIRDLTVRMTGAHTYARAKHHTDQVLHPDFGVLARLGEFFEAAAEQAQASETDEGWELHYRFMEAADTLTGLREELDDASEELRSLGLPRQLRELGPPEPPHWRDRVAHYNATAPKRPTAPTSDAAATRPAPPASPAPSPRRHH
ncbi:hypothetical protein [Streptomyces sp. NPDC048172]|uniref:hypothetical protein n=1 Tax=Streptomyces sp. NPDC048172 TaxID=3365505 RepID=UPI00371A226B